MHEKPRLPIAIIGFALATSMAALGAYGQATAKPQAHETNVDGVTAEIAEAVRKEGVLTIKVRYRNSGSAPAKVTFLKGQGTVDNFHTVAGSTKFLVLRDSKKVPLMATQGTGSWWDLNAEIKPGGSFLFWAKYPAPPAEAKKFTFYNPHTPPIEDVPITEAK